MLNNVELLCPCELLSNGWYPCSLAMLRGSKSGVGKASEFQSYQSQPSENNRKIIINYRLLTLLFTDVISPWDVGCKKKLSAGQASRVLT